MPRLETHIKYFVRRAAHNYTCAKCGDTIQRGLLYRSISVTEIRGDETTRRTKRFCKRHPVSVGFNVKEA